IPFDRHLVLRQPRVEVAEGGFDHAPGMLDQRKRARTGAEEEDLAVVERPAANGVGHLRVDIGGIHRVPPWAGSLTRDSIDAPAGRWKRYEWPESVGPRVH